VARGVALLACVLVASASAATASPTLSLVSRSPLVLRGTHFEPLERVGVTVYARTRLEKNARATSVGSFRVAFDGVYVGRCSSLRVVAVGVSGSSAALKSLPLPGCLPA
jgi:hypothetical protein